MRVYNAETIIPKGSRFWHGYYDDCNYLLDMNIARKESLNHGERIIVRHKTLEFIGTIDLEEVLVRNLELI